VFISFSGIDGAGKTTQIELLSSSLKKLGLAVRLISFWNDVATLTRLREFAGYTIFRGDRGAGSPSAPVNRRDKNVHSPIMSAVRLCLYELDSLSLRSTMMKAISDGGDAVVIFDRFIYDELANLDFRNPVARAYIRHVSAFVPSPHISFLLDADPEQARARKPEYPIEFLRANREAYLALGGLACAFTVIEPMPVDSVARTVLQHVMNELSPWYAWRDLNCQALSRFAAVEPPCR